MTDKQQDMLNTISIADMCSVISSREQAYKDEIRRLRKANGELAGQKASLERWFGEAKSIIREYVDYPTSNDELWKLHEKAEQFLSEVKE